MSEESLGISQEKPRHSLSPDGNEALLQRNNRTRSEEGPSIPWGSSCHFGSPRAEFLPKAIPNPQWPAPPQLHMPLQPRRGLSSSPPASCSSIDPIPLSERGKFTPRVTPSRSQTQKGGKIAQGSSIVHTRAKAKRPAPSTVQQIKTKKAQNIHIFHSSQEEEDDCETTSLLHQTREEDELSGEELSEDEQRDESITTSSNRLFVSDDFQTLL